MQLELPVRLRWRGPHGMQLELARTVDVSREGLLLQFMRCRERCRDECPVGSRLWVTYPYERAMSPTSLAETAARVARVEPLGEGVCRIALHFDLPRKAAFGRPGVERRASQRVYAAVAVFVRGLHSEWPEECMTQDLSRGGMRFETFQSCAPGDLVLAKVHWGEWAQAGEVPGRVLRVNEMPASPAAPLAATADQAGQSHSAVACFSVAVQWMKSFPQSTDTPEI